MNIGDNRWHRKYICDKCQKEIPFIGQKGFVGINRYCKSTHRDINYKKDFDLCSSCEKKFRKWLSEKEIPRIEDVKENFPRWEG